MIKCSIPPGPVLNSVTTWTPHHINHDDSPLHAVFQFRVFYYHRPHLTRHLFSLISNLQSLWQWYNDIKRLYHKSNLFPLSLIPDYQIFHCLLENFCWKRKKNVENKIAIVYLNIGTKKNYFPQQTEFQIVLKLTSALC